MIGHLAPLLLLAAGMPPTDTEDGPLGLSDLPAYREALASSIVGPASPATFRQLWEHPEAHRGRPVRVSGSVVRRFRQPPVGEFPALAEVWIVTPEGDPFCLVHPEASAKAAPRLGDPVRFSGVFLRRIRYEGRDAARLAPLIVGNGAPVVVTPAGSNNWGGGRVDWAIAAVLGVVALAILAGRRGNRPVRRRPDGLPAPRWIEPGEPGAHGDGRED